MDRADGHILDGVVGDGEHLRRRQLTGQRDATGGISSARRGSVPRRQHPVEQ
jgi:hypothetical protein